MNPKTTTSFMASSRLPAALVSPLAASDSTISAVTSLYRCRWFSHHDLVIACLAASSPSGERRATRYDGIVVSR